MSAPLRFISATYLTAASYMSRVSTRPVRWAPSQAVIWGGTKPLMPILSSWLFPLLSLRSRVRTTYGTK